MSSKSNDNKNGNKEIPDSGKKQARGSKNVHSSNDDSQEDGWKPNKPDKEKSEEE